MSQVKAFLQWLWAIAVAAVTFIAATAIFFVLVALIASIITGVWVLVIGVCLTVLIYFWFFEDDQ
jgi:xanthine/uracil permease